MMKYALKQISLHSDIRKLSIYLVQWRGGGGGSVSLWSPPLSTSPNPVANVKEPSAQFEYQNVFTNSNFGGWQVKFRYLLSHNEHGFSFCLLTYQFLNVSRSKQWPKVMQTSAFELGLESNQSYPFDKEHLVSLLPGLSRICFCCDSWNKRLLSGICRTTKLKICPKDFSKV